MLSTPNNQKMIVINSISGSFQFLLITIFILSITNSIVAQSKSADKDGQNNNEISLQDLSEAVLVNGKPTLKILSRKKGGYTEVKLQKRDNEDALVFDVVKLSVKNPVGKLFVTKTKVIFEAYEKKEKNFSIEKSALKKYVLKKSLDGFPSIRLEFDSEEAKLQIKFDRFQLNFIDRASQNAAHEFLYRAIENFDSALKEFNELTKATYLNEK